MNDEFNKDDIEKIREIINEHKFIIRMANTYRVFDWFDRNSGLILKCLLILSPLFFASNLGKLIQAIGISLP